MPDDILDVAKTMPQYPPVTNPPAPDGLSPLGTSLPPEPKPDISPPPALTVPEQPSTPVLPIPTEEAPQATAFVTSILETTNPELVIPKVPSHHSTLPKKGPPKGLILGILALLLVALPVAVFFISQQNQQIADFRSRATGNTYSCGRENDPGAPICCTTTCKPENRVCEPPNRLECEQDDGTWCTIEIGGCVPPDDDDDDTTNPTATPTRPASTATPTTGTTPVCQNIKIYKERVVLVTDLSSLRAGDDVVLAVKGNLNPTKAHFRVNGGTWTETTFKNGSGEFTLTYTIPTGVTEFVIEGEVFTNGAWR